MFLFVCVFVVAAEQKDWRSDYQGAFKKKVKQCVRKSQEL